MIEASPLPFGTAFDRTQRLSQYVRRTAAARPEIVAELEARAARAFTREEMRAELAPGEDLDVRLRRLRNRVMVATAHRDLNGLATLDEVFATMTALADESIAAAAAQAQLRMSAVHGVADGADLIVAALGKLGGCELNVSSDVDLIFLYGADGTTPGPRSVSHQEYFAAAGRAVIALLSEVTAEGQPFRVDMRLRPFGISGPLVTSLPVLEDYFIGHARPWERYAWLKARVVAGPDEGVAERVQPFVYRRYLDYSLIDSLREIHSRIFEAAVQRRKADDIKVGTGGIREIEFAVQLLQLVRGGREAALRTTSTRSALAVLGERGLMTAERARTLGDAYAFLRRLEHRLQYYDDQQTQALPRGDEHRALIAEAMDHPDWESLAEDLQKHRDQVQAAFNELFEDDTPRDKPAAARLTGALFDPQAAPDAEELADQLRDAGVVEASQVATALIDYTRSRRFGALSASSRSKLEKLLPDLIAAVAAEGGTQLAAARLIQLLEAIDRRDAYYSLLAEHPHVLRRAAHLMVRSAWAARLLARHPILLDELTRGSSTYASTDWAAERAELTAECIPLLSDVERLLDHLRHYKQRQVLRLTIADIEGELPLMALSDELSKLADVVLEVTLAMALRSVPESPASAGTVPEFSASVGTVPEFSASAGTVPEFSANDRAEKPGLSPVHETGPGRHRGDDAHPAIAEPLGPGRHRGDDAHPAIAGFCIVGYGKLGGKELGYGSDLDVVFLYDATRAGEADRLTRAAQRVNNWMTSLTAGGVLYDMDLRLRPDGMKGLLVGSIESFREYQEKRAWTWEHQALTRARACAGDPSLGARFEQVRDALLAQPRDREKLFSDVVAMRRKMRAEHRADAQDIKHIEGGIIDLEFCVQALVLAEGPAHPALRENKGNHTLLKRAGELGLIDKGLAHAAAEAYLAMRQRAHQAALNDEEKVKLAPDELLAEREAVKQLWMAVFPNA